jgi:hypothetical protein
MDLVRGCIHCEESAVAPTMTSAYLSSDIGAGLSSKAAGLALAKIGDVEHNPEHGSIFKWPVLGGIVTVLIL